MELPKERGPAPKWDCYGNKGLPVGWHTVTVVGFDTFTSRKGGNPCVRLYMEGNFGRFCRMVAVCAPNNHETLARFARACGLTDDELLAYDPETGHDALIGKIVEVRVEKPDFKWSDVPFPQQGDYPFRLPGTGLAGSPVKPSYAKAEDDSPPF